MRWKSKGFIAGIVAIFTLVPVTAHADQGVLLESHQVTDSKGTVIHKYDKGERIRIGESEDSYVVTVESVPYEIKKNKILKTLEEEEVSLLVKGDQVKVYSSPSLFSTPIHTLKSDSQVKRLSPMKEEKPWIQVETDDGVIGYALHKFFEPQYKTTPSAPAKAYLVEEWNSKDISLNYGQEIEVEDYKDNQFITKRDGKTYSIPDKHISFEKPTKPLVVDRVDDDSLYVYGNPTYISPVYMKIPPVSSRYGMRWGKLHAGTDLALPTGTPLYAVADGIIKVAVKDQGQSKVSWGNYVRIDHGEHDTLYGHMSKVIVAEKQQVKQGQLIGYSGNSGRSTGSHLHFEYYVNGVTRTDSHFIVYQPNLYK